jgi:CRP-like cAMP-binding protein
MTSELEHKEPVLDPIAFSPVEAFGSSMETSPNTPRQNHLLGALPAEEWDRLRPQMELRRMPLGHVLYESGDSMRHVYFPTTSIISLLYVMEDGSSAEIAIVGNEGIVGISLFMGGETTPSRAIVQSAGNAYRVAAQYLKEEFFRAGPVQQLLLRYTQALITQMAQTAVCNRHHSVEQQLCRWLLMSLDRLPSNELTMTQELIANMLGVRREGVTESAGKLQKLGLIHYNRGHIVVINRPALESHSCECYAVVKKEFDRLLPWIKAQSGV